MPNDQFPPEDPFYRLEGKDGYHVIQTEFGSILTLSVISYSGGEPCSLEGEPGGSSVDLFEASNATPAKRGECIRLRLVMDAVCRYFTTGGSWEELVAVMKQAKKVIIGGIAFPGYDLITSYSTIEGDYQHLFQKQGTDSAVLWNEPEVGDNGTPVGGWISPTTLQRFHEEQESDETAWGQTQTEFGRNESRESTRPVDLCNPLQLPDRKSDGHADDAEGCNRHGLPGDNTNG